jgi:hypothetical protein
MVHRPFRRQRFLIHQRSSVETSPVTIAEFIAKWKKAELKERAAAQEHFLDLCYLAQLDAAVCAAYGWDPSIGNDEILRALLALNALRSISVSPVAAE